MAATTESINVPTMQMFIGVKIIKAKPMTRENAEALLCRDVGGSKNGDGYLVEYEDGYQSWSPKAVFETAYRLTRGAPFGLAVEAMKKGLRVARAGWIGYLTARLANPDNSNSWVFEFYFSSDRLPVPWTVYHDDLFTEDWQIVEQ